MIWDAFPNKPEPDIARVPALTVTAPAFVLTPVIVRVPAPTLVNPSDAVLPSEKVPSNSWLLPSLPTVSVAALVVFILRTLGPSINRTLPELTLARFDTVRLLPNRRRSPPESKVSGPVLIALLFAACIEPAVINVEA